MRALLLACLMLMPCGMLRASEVVLDGLASDTLMMETDAARKALSLIAIASASFTEPAAALPVELAQSINVIDMRETDVLEKQLELLARQPEAAAQVRVAAMRFWAKMLFGRGKFLQAQRLLVNTGLITTWRVAGPFGTHNNADFYTSFSPEQSLSTFENHPDDAYGTQAWSLLETSQLDGKLYPRSLEPAQREGVWYLLTQLKTTSDSDAFLEIETDASIQVWWDGQLVMTVDRLKGFPALGNRIPLHLRADGTNRLMIKCVSTTRNVVLQASLFDTNGNPLVVSPYTDVLIPFSKTKEVSSLTTESSHPATSDSDMLTPDKNKYETWKRSLMLREAAVFADAWIWDLARREPKNVRALMAAAQTCIMQKMPDAGLSFAKAAFAQKSCPMTALLLADAAQAAWHLPEDMRNNLSVEAWSHVDQKTAVVLLGMARLEIADERFDEALRHLSTCLKWWPDNLMALRLRAELAQDRDWPAESLTWLDELRRNAPDALVTHLLTARYHVRQRVWNTAAQAYQKALLQNASSLRLYEAAVHAAQRIDEHDMVRTMLAPLDACAAKMPEVLCLQAEEASMTKKVDEAVALMRAAVRCIPEDAGMIRTLADMAYRAGKQEEALAAWKQSLALDPSQYGLRLLIDKLEHVNQADFWSRFDRDPVPAMERALTVHNGKTIRALDQAVIQFYPDGSRSDMEYGLQVVLNRSGVQDAARIGIRGEILEARTIMPGGRQVQEPIRIPGQSVFTMPGLMPGAAVETRFLAHYGMPRKGMYMAPGFFFRSPDGEESYLLSEYIVRVPTGLPFGFIQRNFPGRPVIRRHADGMTTYIWSVTDTQRVPDEEGTPPPDDFLPYVQVGVQTDWKDVHAEMMNEYIRQTRPSIEIHEAVQMMLGPDAPQDPREQTRRIFAWIQEHIEPSPIVLTANATLARRTGNRLLLLLTSLHAAGISAEYAGARPSTHFMVDADWKMPSLFHFPIRVIHVSFPDGGDMWLDTRFRTNIAGEILDDLSGATAFVCSSEGGRLVTIPEQPSGNFRTFESVEMTFDPEARSVHVEGDYVLRGLAGKKRAEEIPLLPRADQVAFLEDRLGNRFGLASTVTFAIQDNVKASTAYRESYIVDGDDFAIRLIDGTFDCPLPITPLHLVDDMDSPPETRQNPFRVTEWHAHTDTVLMRLPSSVAPARLPEEYINNTSFGNYRLMITPHENCVRIERTFQIPPQLITAKEFPSFIHFLREIRTAEAQRIRLLPIETAAPSASSTHDMTEDELNKADESIPEAKAMTHSNEAMVTMP